MLGGVLDDRFVGIFFTCLVSCFGVYGVFRIAFESACHFIAYLV